MTKKCIIVNLFSGPGAGKSTTAAGLFYKLKKQGVNCELVTEYAKHVTWRGNFSTLKNQVYVGDTIRRDVFVSKNTSYTDYTYTVGAGIVRVPGEGALLTLDSTPVAFAPQEQDMYVATNDGWFRTSFTLAQNLLTEDLKVERLKTLPNKGALGKNSVCKIQNDTAFFTKDKTIDFIGRIENIDTTQSKPISDPIKLELLDYDLTIPPHLYFHQSKLYCSFPSEGKTLIYDFEKAYWNPPQILPIRRGAIIASELYGHSSAVPETYKLFDEATYSDNGNPIDARAVFSYRNYGIRELTKYMNEFFVEGYIQPNTTLTTNIKYEIDGCSTSTSYDLDGTDTQNVCIYTLNASLGKTSLGKKPLGGTNTTTNYNNLPKFRVIYTFPRTDFYEAQYSFTSSGIDYHWEILAFGGLVTRTMFGNNNIKK